MSLLEKHGKRRQVTYRIGPVAEERLRQVAELFNLKPSEYAKAVLYRDLGVFSEPLDQRRRNYQRKKRQEQEEDDLIGFEENSDEESEDSERFTTGRGSTYAPK